MMIKGRKKGAGMMFLLWCAAPVTFLAYSIEHETEMFFLITLLTSALIMAAGIAIYLGHVNLLAGFNTMDPKERAKYNVEKLSSFMGIWLVLMAFVMFFTTFAASVFMSEFAVVIVFTAVITVMTFFAVIYANGKKFIA
ncbi:MAG: DUF3784 domain-containing protein [Methanomassiliicoccaceae archaeon]|nr:DUF3784 domain-containing protein [Methanomassiliicoccaceae archaeon]